MGCRWRHSARAKATGARGLRAADFPGLERLGGHRDAGGRILLPKKVRQRLGLAAGDELDVESPVTGLADAGEDAILLRVVRPEAPSRRESKFSSLPRRRGVGTGGCDRYDYGRTRGALGVNSTRFHALTIF